VCNVNFGLSSSPTVQYGINVISVPHYPCVLVYAGMLLLKTVLPRPPQGIVLMPWFGYQLLVVAAVLVLTLVLHFWYQLTWVVLEKGPLNGCVCVQLSPVSNHYRAMLCIRGTSHGPVSVCPSQVSVLLKRLNVGSRKQHHTIA